MPLFVTEIVKNSNKVERIHKSREEAFEYLQDEAYGDYVDKIVSSGSRTAKINSAKAHRDALDIRLAEIDAEIYEYKRVDS